MAASEMTLGSDHLQGDHGGWKSWKNGDFEKLGWKSWKTSSFFGVEGWKSWNF